MPIVFCSCIEEESAIAGIFYGRRHLPTVFGIDLKSFITYRFAMNLWALYVISAIHYAFKSWGRINGRLLIVSALQLAYIARRQWFISATSGLDNQLDMAGFYRLWGVMVLLPTLYATPVTVLAMVGGLWRYPRNVSQFREVICSIYQWQRSWHSWEQAYSPNT